MKDNKVQIDTGRDILTLESTTTRNATIITAYVNGISIRSGSLHIVRIADAFVDTVVSACAIRVDSTWLKKDVKKFITDTLQ
jgi:hypothetical protein